MEGMIYVYMFKLLLFGGYGIYYWKLCVRFKHSADQLHPVRNFMFVLSALQLTSHLLLQYKIRVNRFS